MKTKRIDLDVDFIGGQGSLTKEEEIALSNYFQQRKSIIRANVKSKGSGQVKTTA